MKKWKVGEHRYFLIDKDGKAQTITKLPEGAVRVHLYNFKNVLRPRGTLQKESLSEYICERLQNLFEDWTDKKYGDSKEPEEVLKQLKENLIEEANNGYDKFFNGLFNKDLGGK